MYNFQISDVQMSQYVGPVDVNGNPFEATTYTNVPAGPLSFSVTGDDDGKFKSLSVQSGLSTFQKNLIRGWAAQFQINAGEIKRGSKAFLSTEVPKPFAWSRLLFGQKFNYYITLNQKFKAAYDYSDSLDGD